MSTTPARGFGASGFGSSAFGYGTPATTSSAPARPLVQSDGTPGNCAKIDAASGDFVLDATGNKVGWDSLNQRVLLALRTKLGSAAVLTMGIDLPAGVISADLATRNRNAVAAALKLLTDQQLVALVDVTTTRVATSGVEIEVRWRRLATGQIESTFL